ncbi:hypothetical protein [Brevibacterium litoralis]|uniref:hypothetical protein n=1 Tax=Brevibacterium litoralis TaxID=3138935 RepID=UPI0032EDAF1C
MRPESFHAARRILFLCLSALLGTLLAVTAVPVAAGASTAEGTDLTPAESAVAAYVAEHVDLVYEAWGPEAREFAPDTEYQSFWEPGLVYADPLSSSFWDERQQDLVMPQVEAARAAGMEVHVALVGSFGATGRDPSASSGRASETGAALWRQIVAGYAERVPEEDAIVVVWDADLGYIFRARISGGELTDDLSRLDPDTQVNGMWDHYSRWTVFPDVQLGRDVPGPGIHYAIRTAVEPSAPSKVQHVESEPMPVLGSQLRPYEVADRSSAADGGVSFLRVFLLVLGLFVLSWVVQAARNRLRGTDRSKARAPKLDEKQRALTDLHLRAARAHEFLDRRKTRISQTVLDAMRRLPEPNDSFNPLVWAAWVQLEREADPGRGGGEVGFFRPDLEAETRVYWDGLGADLEIPVSRQAARDLDEDRMPSYLSADGISTGTPYWREDRSPFAASGMGAFGPVSAALIAMPSGWTPEHGTVDIDAFTGEDDLPGAAPEGSGTVTRTTTTTRSGTTRTTTTRTTVTQETNSLHRSVEPSARERYVEIRDEQRRQSARTGLSALFLGKYPDQGPEPSSLLTVRRQSSARDEADISAAGRAEDVPGPVFGKVVLGLAAVLTLAGIAAGIWNVTEYQRLATPAELDEREVAAPGEPGPDPSGGEFSAQVDPRRAAAISTALADTGLYIDPELRRRVAPEEEEQLRALVAEADLPFDLFIAVAGSTNEDEYRGAEDNRVAEYSRMLESIAPDAVLLDVSLDPGMGSAEMDHHSHTWGAGPAEDGSTPEIEFYELGWNADEGPLVPVIEDYVTLMEQHDWSDGSGIADRSEFTGNGRDVGSDGHFVAASIFIVMGGLLAAGLALWLHRVALTILRADAARVRTARAEKERTKR